MALFYEARLVGMDADGGKNPRIGRRWRVGHRIELFRELKGAADVVRSIAVADGEQRLDSGSAGASQGIGAIVAEARAFEMAMRVNQHKNKSAAD